MAHSSFSDTVLYRLNQVAPITARPRFDGYSLYCDRVMFALIVDDTLYFKVDDRTRKDFLKAELLSMEHADIAESETTSYCPMPAEILEDHVQLIGWLEKAVAAGKRSQRKAKRDRSSWKKHSPLAPEW